jgi:hypothetical protein
MTDKIIVDKDFYNFIETEILDNISDSGIKSFFYYILDKTFYNSIYEEIPINRQLVADIIKSKNYRPKIDSIRHVKDQPSTNKTILIYRRSYKVDVTPFRYGIDEDVRMKLLSFFRRLRLPNKPKNKISHKIELVLSDTGKAPKNVKKLKMERYEGKHRLPDKINNAMLAFKQPLININLMLKAEEMILADTKETFDFNDSDIDGNITRVSIDKGKFVKYSKFIKTRLKQQNYSPEDNRYYGWYHCIDAGRIYGCFQGVGRYMKQLLFNDFFNYDIKNCHIQLFLHLCQKHNIKTPYFDQYTIDSEFKQNKAKELHIGVDGLKTLVFASVYGSTLSLTNPKFYQKKENKKKKLSQHDKKKNTQKPAILKVSEDEVHNFFKSIMPNGAPDIEDFEQYKNSSPEALRSAMLPYKTEVNKLISVLSSKQYIDQHTEINNINKTRYIRNDCDRLFYLNEKNFTQKGNLKRKKATLLLSHITMGMEANLIHSLTNNVVKLEPNNEVIQNEHDGLIIQNRLKQSTIDQTIKDTGYDFMEIKPKPLYEHDVGLISKIKYAK